MHPFHGPSLWPKPQHSLGRRLALGLLGVFAVLATSMAARAEVIARHGQGRLERRDGRLVLFVKGRPYEMGYQHGVLLRDLVRRGVRQIIDNQGELGATKQYKAYKLMRPLMHLVLRRHVPERFLEEMRGLADGAGLPYRDVEAANLFPEAFHCSGIALKGKATKGGELYHVRVLDYMTKMGLQDCAVVIQHDPDDEHRWVNASFAGFIGTVTGMNERQIAIGEMGGRGLFYWNGVPMSLLLRDVLERADTLEEATEILRKSKRTCEYYYLVSDGKSGKALGFWTTSSDFEIMRPGGTFGFITTERVRGGAAGPKSFLDEPELARNPHRIVFRDKRNGVEGFIAIQPEDCLILSGYDRYEHFVERLMPRYGEVDERALMEMIRQPVSMSENLHCAIFKPHTLDMWLAVAASDGSPACDQPYFHFKLEPRSRTNPKPTSDDDNAALAPTPR